ncbi:MAG: ABC transporter permease [Bacteroidetes bacterium]|nr:ABC transporter permease [Bacteroidota bacterium]
MHVATRIAWRYLLSRRLPGPVNVISWIAVSGVMLGTAALYIILSVFNGFAALIGNVFQSFDPHLKIAPVSGQYFTYDEALLNKVRNVRGVAHAVPTVEGRALLRYHQNQAVVTLKGVPPDFRTVSRVEEALVHGQYALLQGNRIQGIVAGGGVAHFVNARLRDVHTPMELIRVSPSANLTTGDPERALNTLPVMMTGVFALQKEYDDKYVLLSLEAARRLLETPEGVSFLEVRLHDREDMDRVQAALRRELGAGFRVDNPWEQHETLYRVMRNEKAVGFLLIVLMLVLYCTNIVGSLSMIVLEKQQDVGILQVMGASRGFIRRVFLTTGLWVGVIGGGTGLLLGWGLSALQEHFHLVKFSSTAENLIVNYFPVETQLADLGWVALTVIVLSLLSALYPAHRAAQSTVLQNLKR